MTKDNDKGAVPGLFRRWIDRGMRCSAAFIHKTISQKSLNVEAEKMVSKTKYSKVWFKLMVLLNQQQDMFV